MSVFLGAASGFDFHLAYAGFGFRTPAFCSVELGISSVRYSTRQDARIELLCLPANLKLKTEHSVLCPCSSYLICESVHIVIYHKTPV